MELELAQRPAVETLLRAMPPRTTAAMKLNWIEGLSWTLGDNGMQLFEMRRAWISEKDPEFLELALLRWSGLVAETIELNEALLTPLVDDPEHGEQAEQRLEEATKAIRSRAADHIAPKQMFPAPVEVPAMTVGGAVERLLESFQLALRKPGHQLDLVAETSWLLDDPTELLAARRLWLSSANDELLVLALQPWGVPLGTGSPEDKALLQPHLVHTAYGSLAHDRLAEMSAAADDRPQEIVTYVASPVDPWNRPIEDANTS